MKQKVFGLHALQGHGKSTIAQHLQVMDNFKVIAFGTSVKQTAAAMYGIELDYFYEGVENFDRNTTIIEPYNMTIRQIMQDTGDMVKNHKGGNFWIEQVRIKLRILMEQFPDHHFIIEDVRFDENNPWGEAGNEAAFIREVGTLIHIDAHERKGREGDHYSHNSEQGVKRLEGDIVIDNNGTLESTTQQLKQLFGAN